MTSFFADPRRSFLNKAVASVHFTGLILKALAAALALAWGAAMWMWRRL